MFTVMVGDRFLMRCGFCALTDWLDFPAFAEVCSSAIHSHFSVLGCGSKSTSFCAETHMCLPGLSSRAGACGSLGRSGQGGTGVSLSPCTDSAVPRCPVCSQRSLQSRAGKAPLQHAAEGEERLGCQPDTGENRCDKRDEKVVPCCGISLISLLASFELRNLRWRDIAPDIPSVPPKPPVFSTGHLVLAAAALCLFFSFFVKCLQGIFLKSCNSIAGVGRALSTAAS